MNAHDINHLVGEFMGLYEAWEDNPSGFSWTALEILAKEGAHAYNEGNGPSFHILSFDGYPHGEFHEKFLGYLLDAGFDPFKTMQAAEGGAWVAVFGHDGLAAAAESNPVSARMLARFQAIARQRLGTEITGEELQRVIRLCPESIPQDLLAKLAPGFA